MNKTLIPKNVTQAGLVFLMMSALVLGSSCSSDSNTTALVDHEVRASKILLEMNDGIELVTFYRLPSGAGPFPTLVVRSPYELPHTPLSGIENIDYTNISEEQYADVGWPEVTNSGYALVIQHTRGREGSGGVFQFANERSDSKQLLEWVAAQPWSNGKIGVAGDSIEAIEAMITGAESPELVHAAFAQIGTPDLINGTMKGPGGVLKLETFFPWGADLVLSADEKHYEALGYSSEERQALLEEMQPIVESVFIEPENAHTVEAWYTPMLDYPNFAEVSPSWNEIILANPYSAISTQFDASESVVPSYYVAAWFDVFGPSQITSFERAEVFGNEQRLLILNGTHFTPESPGAWPIQPMLPWFDYHLKGNESALLEMPRVIFPIANADDEWFGVSTWPPTVSRTENWVLSATGKVVRPAGDEIISGVREFLYDPENPVPTVGGRNLIINAGPLDQQAVREDQRNDVLSYDSDILDESVVVAGHLYSTISVSSNAPDTDITVKLLDVSPSGEAILVTEGIQRLRYRDGQNQERLMRPGEIYNVRIDIGHIAWRFKEGHRISVDISSSNFPQWDRNLNTGSSLYNSSDSAIATNIIHHGSDQVSAIELPVISDLDQLQRLDLHTNLEE